MLVSGAGRQSDSEQRVLSIQLSIGSSAHYYSRNEVEGADLSNYKLGAVDGASLISCTSDALTPGKEVGGFFFVSRFRAAPCCFCLFGVPKCIRITYIQRINLVHQVVKE